MARASSDASQVRLAFAIAPLATANIFLLLILSITLLTLSLPLGGIVILSIPAVLWLASNFSSKAMGVSLVSFLVGVCVAAVVRKTVSTLRFFEYLKFIRSLKVKIPKLKKNISRREFISLKIFEFKNA